MRFDSISMWDSRYEIVGQPSRGVAGDVYAARCTVTGARVRVHSIDRPDLQRQAVGRWFVAEYPRLERFRHPHVARLIDGRPQSDDWPAYVVYEDRRGQMLRDVAADRAESPRWVVDRVVELADALEALHRDELLYLGISPDRIEVDKQEGISLLDFGLPALIAVTGGQLQKGGRESWQFPSPEQRAGEKGDERSDLHALGRLLYWLLIGAQPGDGVEPPVYLDDELAAIWRRCLVEDPDGRFVDVPQLRRELTGYLSAHDKASAHVLVGPDGQRVALGPTATIGSGPESVMPLPDHVPVELFRLLRPSIQTLLLPSEGIRLTSGEQTLGRFALRHLDAIDFGPLRFVYRRESDVDALVQAEDAEEAAEGAE